MCTAPILIPNPYYQLGSKGLNFLHDTVNTHIQVPCGICHQCCSLRQAYFNQRIQMESLRSEMFMITLTYNDFFIPQIHYKGYHLFFPDWRDIQLLFKKLRKILPHPIRYSMVSEFGSKKKRPHYHGIIAVSRSDIKQYYKDSVSLCEQRLSQLFLDNWSVNIGTKRVPDYRRLCTYIVSHGRRTFDFHHIQPLVNHDNDVTFYVSKYVLKYDSSIQKLLRKFQVDVNLSDDQCSLLTSLIKPRITISKDFGSPLEIPEVMDYITKCIERNELDIPQFYDLYTGQSSLLSRYYRKHCYKIKHALSRYYLSDSPNILSSHVDCDLSIYDLALSSNSAFRESAKFRKIKNRVELHDNWL